MVEQGGGGLAPVGVGMVHGHAALVAHGHPDPVPFDPGAQVVGGQAPVGGHRRAAEPGEDDFGFSEKLAERGANLGNLPERGGTGAGQRRDRRRRDPRREVGARPVARRLVFASVVVLEADLRRSERRALRYPLALCADRPPESERPGDLGQRPIVPAVVDHAVVRYRDRASARERHDAGRDVDRRDEGVEVDLAAPLVPASAHPVDEHVQRRGDVDPARVSQSAIGELDGEGEVTGGVIVMRSGKNALETIDAVKAKFASLQSSLPPGVEIMTGSDTFICEAMVLGCDGALIGFAGTATAELIDMHRRVVAKDFAGALAIWERLGPLARYCWRNPIRDYRPRMKEVLVMQGLIAHAAVRPPQLGVGSEERAELRRLAAFAGLLKR